jgi:hypothetical protein
MKEQEKNPDHSTKPEHQIRFSQLAAHCTLQHSRNAYRIDGQYKFRA